MNMRTSLNLLGLFTLACTLLWALAACEKKSGPAKSSVQPAPGAVSPRIVVLSPALAVILRDLGLESAIVGRHAWDMALDTSLPICGDQAGVDYEALLKVNPTHVVVQWGARELPGRFSELAHGQGWAVIDLNPLSLDDISTAARSLAAAFAPAIEAQGSKAKADQMLAALDAACTTADEAPWKGRVLLLESVDPPAALGPTSWHHEILIRMGASSALAGGGPYQRLDAEDLLKLAPDGIVLLQPRDRNAPADSARNMSGEFPEGELERRLGSLAGLNLPAVKAGRVAIIDEPLALTPSTSIIDFRRRLREVFKAWAK